MPRRLLQSLARTCGLLVVGRNHTGTRYLRHPPRTTFDQVLLHCFASLQHLNFIQIGANNGERADPLARYLAQEAWTGLMFEPLEVNFAALAQRHQAKPGLRLRRMAVDRTPGRRLIYDIDRTAHPFLPDWAYGLASFDRDRVLQAARELKLDETAIIAEEVATTSWDEVWCEFGAQRCDLLVLDTEGYDLPLLRAAELSRHRPRVIHFEHACATQADRLAIYAELLDLGYELATEAGDTTAWLPA